MSRHDRDSAAPPPCLASACRWQDAGVEPHLDHVMADPLVHLVMRRDGVSLDDLRGVVVRARQALGRLPDRKAAPQRTHGACA